MDKRRSLGWGRRSLFTSVLRSQPEPEPEPEPDRAENAEILAAFIFMVESSFPFISNSRYAESADPIAGQFRNRS
jgi:hypothetical protein